MTMDFQDRPRILALKVRAVKTLDHHQTPRFFLAPCSTVARVRDRTPQMYLLARSRLFVPR